MQFTQSDDGVQVGFELTGASEAPPLVILPGGPCHGPEYLEGVITHTPGRSVATIHPRGTIATGGLSRGWWLDAADVIAVGDALGLRTMDLVVHSARTRLALAVAAQFPDRVRSLALLTPPASWLTGTAHDGHAIALRRQSPVIDAAVASMDDTPPTDEAEFQRAWSREAAAGYARWTSREQAHARQGRMSFAAALAWFHDVPEDVAQRILAAPQPRTLVVGGAEDILTGVAPVKAYAAALGAELRLIENAGHYPWVEQPAVHHAILEDWLDASRR